VLKLTWFKILTIITSIGVVVSNAQFQAEAAQVLFTPELLLTEEYSDNVYLTHENEEDDFITSAGLSLTAQVVGRTAGVELNYTPTYNAFADNSDLNYWRHAARLRAWNDFSRNTRFEFINDYLESEDPLDETADFTPDDPLQGPSIDPDYNRRGRGRYRINAAEASLTHQFGAKDRIYGTFQYSFLEDVDTFAGQPVDDYTNLRPAFGLDYWFSQNWGTEIEGFYSNRDYEEKNDRQEYTGYFRLLYSIQRNLSAFAEYRHTFLDYDEETDDDYHIYFPTVGIRYQFQETAHVLLGAGYFIQDVDNQEDNEEGWGVNAEIYKRWAFRSSYIDVAGSGGYDIDDTGTADLGFALIYLGRLGVGYNFTSRFSAEANAAYIYKNYPNREPERTDNIIDAGAGIRYQALTWMFLGLNYRYRDFQSDIITQEYTENRVIFSITMRPATAYRWN